VPGDLAQSIIPGVLQHDGMEDLITAIASFTVTVIDPADGEGQAVTRPARP
jgi:hypothetical protein